ncbi:MAG TPA: redoxin domain-containing protein [Gemmatimonadota bacterium]|nr:redoxin domain-containing protein [Gemmatimonadota bacterium]
MAVQEGDRAPGFSLPAAPGKTVDVGGLIGREKVALLFIPLAFSPTCTTELGTFRSRWSEFEGLDARVFAISVDSPFVTARFRQDEEIPFPVLSDFNRDVSERYGVLYDELLGLEGVSKRAVFVIGEDGRVAYRWVSEDPGVEPDYDAVRSAIRSA